MEYNDTYRVHYMNCRLVPAFSISVDWDTMISCTTIFHAPRLSVAGKEAAKRDKQDSQRSDRGEYITNAHRTRHTKNSG